MCLSKLSVRGDKLVSRVTGGWGELSNRFSSRRLSLLKLKPNEDEGACEMISAWELRHQSDAHACLPTLYAGCPAVGLLLLQHHYYSRKSQHSIILLIITEATFGS